MTTANGPDGGEIRRLEFDVDFPPGHAAAYLVPGDEPLLIDAGTPGGDGEAALADGLAEWDLSPADVAHVLLTHAHVDHVGQVAHLRDVADPTIHAPRPFEDHLHRDVDALADASRANLREAGVDPETVDRILPEYRKSEAIIRDALPVSAVDHWIEPGDPTAVGPLAVDPIYAPGHHLTHVCYAAAVSDDRVLFSGDMAIEPFRAMTIHAGFDDGVTDGVDAFLTALDRLAGESVDRVFPGHGPVHAAFDQTVSRSQDDLERRLATCASTLRPGGSTPLQVAGTLANDDEAAARLLPEVVAALATLESRGRARSRLEDGVRYYVPA